MKKMFYLICCVALGMSLSKAAYAATLNDAAADIARYFSGNPGKTVAVLAFQHSDARAGLEATRVQERFIELLVAAGTVSVIERDRIEQILREHQLDQSGATDKTRIGQLLQADFLLTGNIAPTRQGKLEISARLVEVTSARIVATARATAERSEFGDAPVVRPRNNYLGEPLVQMAILLDTSNSMDGLIDQARTQIWKIVNTLANGSREGKRPRLEVALYEYGNSNLSASDHFVRRVLHFTTSLDKVSEKLFELKTDGGEEYPGAVIARALRELEWKEYDDVYRVIFIAGNEAFTQGPVDFRASMADARRMGIFVNTIFCGSRQEGIATQWLAGAELAQGDFHVINQDRMVQVISTPYDAEIERLGSEYNTTVIPVGHAGREEADRMRKQDAKIAQAAPASGASVERALAKNTDQYSQNNFWDLTTLFQNKQSVATVRKEELPGELKGKSGAELEAYVKEKAARRAKIQARIDELKRKRNEYISRQAAKSAGQSDLCTAMQTSVKTQGKKSGIAF